MTSACKFCDLIRRPALEQNLRNLILETPSVVVALNRRPAAPGHVTMILKAHHETTAQFADAHLSGAGDWIGRLAVALEALYRPERVVVLGDGKRSAHLHLHLIPEPKGAPLDLGAVAADLNDPERAPTLSAAETDAIVGSIRKALHLQHLPPS